MKQYSDIKIVLLSIEGNSERVKRQFSPPFGILIAATVLADYGFNIIIRHLIDHKGIERELEDTCSGATAVGFSTMTSSNLISTIKATRIVKENGYYTFWGGIHATLLPEISLKESSLDAVLRGEAESNLYQFVLWRLGKSEPTEVKGLCYKNSDGEIYISDIPNPVPELKLSHHSFHLIDLNPYLEKEKDPSNAMNYIKKRMLPFLTSKGCNKKCTFCYNSVISHHKWRGYDLGNVFTEMDWIIDNYKVEGWLFYDDNFFCDSERAWKILDRYKMPSFVEIPLEKINKLFLEKAKKLSVERIFIGIESGSDIILKRLKKGFDRKQINEKIQLLKVADIQAELSFMMLFPHESPEDLESTLCLIDELTQFENISIAGPKIYTPYPGTQLYKELVISGWKPPLTNEEWSQFERHISPFKTGFNLSARHLSILESRRLI